MFLGLRVLDLVQIHTLSALVKTIYSFHFALLRFSILCCTCCLPPPPSPSLSLSSIKNERKDILPFISHVRGRKGHTSQISYKIDRHLFNQVHLEQLFKALHPTSTPPPASPSTHLQHPLPLPRSRRRRLPVTGPRNFGNGQDDYCAGQEKRAGACGPTARAPPTDPDPMKGARPSPQEAVEDPNG